MIDRLVSVGCESAEGEAFVSKSVFRTLIVGVVGFRGVGVMPCARYHANTVSLSDD